VGWEAFEVTPKEHEEITGRLEQVLGRAERAEATRRAGCRQLDQGPDVHVHTGSSVLTARGVLDRLLRRVS
jgi:hypothetical protein